MNHLHKAKAYILVILSISFLIFSCEDSIVDPKEVPTGEHILFIKKDRTIIEICYIKPDGSDLQVIANHDVAGEFVHQGYQEAKWSPNKSQIVISGGPNESLESNPLWLMDNEGNLLKQLTTNGGSPTWRSDGDEILFVRPMHPTSVIIDYYTINVRTLNERLVLSADSFFWWSEADWSSDGQYILTNEEYPYINEEGEGDYTDREIVQIRLSNGEKIQLTDNDVQDGGARWSPDESQIVYASGSYVSGHQVKLINSDGTGEITILDTLASYGSFAWSPIGDKIAFTKRKKLEGWINYEEGSDIFVYDMISGEVEQLTNFAVDSIHVYVQDWK
jgi:Tol biopolymer transport system component